MDNWCEYDGHSIFYRSVGGGNPIVLLHGFGEDGEVWKYQIDFLSKKCRVIIPDIPGSGRSPTINNTDPGKQLPTPEITVEYFAEFVKSILDKEQINSCTMIGHSMGGYIALAFAEKYPNRLDGLGLFHSTAYPDSEEKKENRLRSIDFIRNQSAFDFLKQVIPGLFSEKYNKTKSNEVEFLVRAGANFSGQALVQYYKAMLVRPDRSPILKNFPRPVLFVVGEEDKIVNLQDSLRQCHIPVLAHVSIFAGVAHMGMWEEKDLSNVAITEYLNLLNAT